MPRPKSFKSSFSCVYLVPEALHKALMTTLNSVQYKDVDRLNQSAMEGHIQTISEGDAGIPSLPPIVKANEKISEDRKEPSERIFEEFSDNNVNVTDVDENLEMTEPGKNDVITETESMKTADATTETSKITTSDMATDMDENYTSDKSTETDTLKKSSSFRYRFPLL